MIGSEYSAREAHVYPASAAEGESAVAVRGLQKKFRGFSLEDITFSVPRGSVVGFIGENGAGKSTTIKSILGLVRPDAGTLSVFGKESVSLSKADRNRVGAVLGETCLPENLNLKDIDAVMRRIFLHWSSSAFFGYADKFSLPRDKKVREFSRGMRQKVSLAVALSHGAELLILDEPTAGLDPVARDEILDILYDFMQSEEHSILISSHIVSDLEKLCDYILFIHEGRIVFFEEKDALREKYAVLHCTFDQLAGLDPSVVVAFSRGEYGMSALVRRDLLPAGMAAERAGIEDIMLYFVRGERI